MKLKLNLFPVEAVWFDVPVTGNTRHKKKSNEKDYNNNNSVYHKRRRRRPKTQTPSKTRPEHIHIFYMNDV